MGFGLGSLTPSAILSGGMNLVSGGLQYLGAREQNATAREIADKQMAFQNLMSSSAHQREVLDLQRAGLNPVLSANAGATTPVGASAPVVNTMDGFAKSFNDVADRMLTTARTAQDINESLSRAKLNASQADALSGGWSARIFGTDIYNGVKGAVKKAMDMVGSAKRAYEQGKWKTMPGTFSIGGVQSSSGM